MQGSIEIDAGEKTLTDITTSVKIWHSLKKNKKTNNNNKQCENKTKQNKLSFQVMEQLLYEVRVCGSWYESNTQKCFSQYSWVTEYYT